MKRTVMPKPARKQWRITRVEYFALANARASAQELNFKLQ